MEQGKKYGHFFSWEIVNDNIAIKEADKSALQDYGSGIPKQTRWFWGAEMLCNGQKKPIHLVCSGTVYDAYLTVSNGRTRLFWDSVLGLFLKFGQVRNYAPYFLRFERLSTDVYQLDFTYKGNVITEKIIMGDDIQMENAPSVRMIDIPKSNRTNRKAAAHSKSKPRSIDFSALHEQNMVTGTGGERLIFELEQQQLIAAGRPDLAKQVLLMQQSEGNTTPFDISSFFPDGRKRYVEVKTTCGGANTAFFLSAGELDFYLKHKGSYILFRICNFQEQSQTADVFVVDDLEAAFSFEPVNYLVKLK